MSETARLLLERLSEVRTGNDSDYAAWHTCTAADIGEILATARREVPTGYDGAILERGARVELDASCDLWMQGAKYGVVTRTERGSLGWVIHVRMDNRRVRRIQHFPSDLLRRAK
jgi:hypothetical protein